MCGCYSKAFDIDMSPLSFGADHLYHFITERFEGTSSPVQEQCLQWLQVYTAISARYRKPVMPVKINYSLMNYLYQGDYSASVLSSCLYSLVKVDSGVLFYLV